MQLSRFQPSDPPSHVKKIMTDLILLQRYRYLKIQKPTIKTGITLEKPQTIFKSFQKVIKPVKAIQTKNKIITKIKNERINIKKQRKVQRLFNLHLLQRLNYSVIQAVSERSPPMLSILDTKQEGDYLPDGDKKQYPHFSNTLKPTEIPNQMFRPYLPTIKKANKNPIFVIEDNCVYKIKQVYRFPKLLFRLGNEQFQQVAAQLSLSVHGVKLLFDLFTDYFEIEDRIDLKSQQQRSKYLKNIKKHLFEAFSKYKKAKQKATFTYIPIQQQFISLRQIRQSLYMKKQESDSSSED